VVAPGATYAARAAVAPTSQRTAEARRAVDERQQAKLAAKTAAAAAPAPSLKGVRAEAITVDAASARAPAFAKVTASATVKATAIHPRTYEVASGDTLSSIARAHAVKVADLRAWNHLKNDRVKPGQQLRLGER
jgi:phosphate transport system substrate-binding protein